MKIYKWKCDVCGKEFEYAPGVQKYSVHITIESNEDVTVLTKELGGDDVCSDCKNKLFASLAPYFDMY